jgi:hypothetical protein
MFGPAAVCGVAAQHGRVGAARCRLPGARVDAILIADRGACIRGAVRASALAPPDGQHRQAWMKD